MKKSREIAIYILALLLTIEVLVALELHRKDEAAIQTLTQQNIALQDRVDEKQKEINELNGSIKEADKALIEQSKLIRKLFDELGYGLEETTDRGKERLIKLGEYTVTAYCSCQKCCGEYAYNRPSGKVYGAAGVELTPGVSVAGWLPFGSHIIIEGQEYIVQDRTAEWIRDKYKGRIIDIYFSDHATALEWGKQKHEVWLVEEGAV